MIEKTQYAYLNTIEKLTQLVAASTDGPVYSIQAEQLSVVALNLSKVLVNLQELAHDLS